MTALYRLRWAVVAVIVALALSIAYAQAWYAGKRSGELQDAQEQIEGTQDAQDAINGLPDDDAGILEWLRKVAD